jgi:hypothetical protein
MWSEVETPRLKSLIYRAYSSKFARSKGRFVRALIEPTCDSLLLTGED